MRDVDLALTPCWFLTTGIGENALFQSPFELAAFHSFREFPMRGLPPIAHSVN
jgi:hypothetical protein